MGAGNWDHHPGNRRFITNFKIKDVKEVMMEEEVLKTRLNFSSKRQLHPRRSDFGMRKTLTEIRDATSGSGSRIQIQT